MSVVAYTTRPLTKELLVEASQGTVEIARLKDLPNGSYVVLAKVIVVTRVDSTGRDSARAEFSLEAPSISIQASADKAMTTLWHARDPGSLQPADTVSLQLTTNLVGRPVVGDGGVIAAPGTSSVILYCKSIMGILELRDIVITAIKVDSIQIVG